MARAARKSAAKPGARRLQSKDTTDSKATTLDLRELDRETLLQLQKDVDQALRTYEKRRRDDALREMQAVAEKHGLSMKEVVGRVPGRAVQAPKYRHPENPALTWSGRGRQPDWFKGALDAGPSREELLVA